MYISYIPILLKRNSLAQSSKFDDSKFSSNYKKQTKNINKIKTNKHEVYSISLNM